MGSTTKATALALGLLLSACTSLPDGEAAALRASDDAEFSLYVRRVELDSSAQDAPLLPTTLVVPGASWLEHDLDPLLAAQPTVFYDMRGRGRSSLVPDSEGMSIERDVADLEQLRAELELERMSLLGWAYGAQVITRYAIQYPERVERLVLVGPLPPKHASYWQSYLRGYALRFKTTDKDSINAMRASDLKSRNPELYCRRVQEASLRTFVEDEACLANMQSRPWALPNLDPELNAQHAEAILDALGDWDWTEELAGLQHPVLVVHGAKELLPLASSEAYVDALPNARLLVIEDAGHMPWLEAPQRFCPPVIAFLGEARLVQDPTPLDR